MQKRTGEIDVSQRTAVRYYTQKLLSKFHAQPVL